MADELTDAEWAQAQKDYADLQAAYKADPKAVREALKDFADFRPKSGDVQD